MLRKTRYILFTVNGGNVYIFAYLPDSRSVSWQIRHTLESVDVAADSFDDVPCKGIFEKAFSRLSSSSSSIAI